MFKKTSPTRPAMLAALALVSVALAACGGSSTSTTASNTTTSASETTTGTATASARTTTSSAATATTSSQQATHSTQSTNANRRTPPEYVAYKAALANYAACMRRHGVDLPGPRTSPSGLPVLSSPKNVSNKSPQFSGALLQCREYVIKITKVSPGGSLGD